MDTSQRLRLAAISLAATATVGIVCYRLYGIYNPSFTEPAADRRLHRSNAVRHRRRSVPHVAHTPDHSRERRSQNPSREQSPERPDSEASYTSAESQSQDENENIEIDNTVPARPLADGETVVDDPTVMNDDWYDDEETTNQYSQQPRAGQNIVSLLFRVSEDNARRSAYVHRGCQCNGCGLVPIRGIRYRCANCPDFDLCETCESQGLHTKTHIFYKIKIPAPRLGPRQLQPVWYPGDPESALRLLPKKLMSKLSKETGFERPELEALWEQWTFMANTEWREDPDELGLAMDRKTFERYLVPSGGYRQTAPNLLHDRMFAFYDDNNDDLIGFSEFLRGTSYRKRKDRLRRIFNGYDVDNDGYVNRRDFLRLFRAYYILFKQMHRDILEGLDDQVMASTEVQQLVTSRQPLSSLFGREGGFHPPDEYRPLEGKVVNESIGEVHVSDGNHSAIVHDTPDTSDRQSLLTDLFMKQESHSHESLFMPVGGPEPRGATSGIDYLNALLDPPNRLRSLPALVVGAPRPRADFMIVVNGRGAQTQTDNDDDDDGEPNGQRIENGASPPGEEESETVQVTDSDGSGADVRSQGRELHRVPYMATSSRRMRVAARKKLFDRWKRRQFYLDEEEGAVAPDDWSDGEDVLTLLNPNTENSKAPHQPMLSRSRSSSKVRFADDDDDYDVRSNPSTSSRSIPERWGGMEIPDAERDVGKEIFYQVIQQAFNEILDTLFKAKEDLAVAAAQTKELRERNRHLFEHLDPHEKEKQKPKNKTLRVKDQSLQELLNVTGYSIAESPTPAATTSEGAGASNENHEEDDVETVTDELAAKEPSVLEDSSSASSYRDPTMPQFRPDSLSASTIEDETTAGESKDPEKASSSTKPVKPALKSTSSTSSNSKEGASSPQPIPRKTLIYWKRIDVAEQEARARGGWGRLSFQEFERIYKEEEATGRRLDYLGTWIDFCIPHS
ncbi:hypothetical protein QBC35DRAFT_277712 [Podospora australis]|uniref:Uncharacterized protein n=1 Tax=Podospora australis TaxID=1536484 RepID=A0AAN6X475_9PEZI|nr:hypothetical protein QBC35DRAFT_277712 [Podospora australis]